MESPPEEGNEKYGNATKEDMFFWSDVEILKSRDPAQSQDDINQMVISIWEVYFETRKLELPLEISEEIHSDYIKGKPYNQSIFNKASEYIFKNAFNSPLRTIFANFATAIMYRKRLTGDNCDIPDEVFNALLNQLNNESQWSILSDKKGILICRGSENDYKGIITKEAATLNAPAEEIVSLFWELERRSELDPGIKTVRMLEKISPQTEISFSQVSAGPMGPVYDNCFLATKKVLNEGIVAIMGCAIDHSGVPNVKIINKVRIDLFAYVITPIDSSTCGYQAWIQTNWDQPVFQFLTRSDWVVKKLARVKKLKKKIDNQAKKKDTAQ